LKSQDKLEKKKGKKENQQNRKKKQNKNLATLKSREPHISSLI
jgi:hypothetical protein